MLSQDTPYPSAGRVAPQARAPTDAAGLEATKKGISWVMRTTSAQAPYTTRLRVVCGRSGNGPRAMVPVSTSDSVAFFFFKYTATTEIYTLSLHDALPI